MMKKQAVVLSSILVLFFFAGCVKPPQKPMGPPIKYTQIELISLANRNMENLGRFRSKGGQLSGKIPTENGKTQNYDLNGVAVLYDNPRNLYLSGSYLGQPGLVIGSGKDKYWMGVMTDPSRLYWGYWKNAGRECNKWRTGGPMRLLEALGQIQLRPQPMGHEEQLLAGPALYQQNEANVLFYFSADEVGTWYIAKEVRLSTHPPIVVNKIIYYDAKGNIETVINFSDHRAVAGGGLMAHKIQMIWPGEKSEMKLNLGKVTLVPELPKEAFVMPDPGTFNEVEQVDKNCK